MSAIRIRRVGRGDLEPVKRLRLSALRLAPSAFGARYEDELAMSDEAWRARIASNAEGRATVGFLAEVEGEAFGLVAGVFEAGPSPSVELVSMWVEPAARGRGAGRALIDAVVTWARSRGAADVHLRVTSDNPDARSLYRTAGFAPSGDGGPCGRHAASELMILSLHQT